MYYAILRLIQQLSKGRIEMRGGEMKYKTVMKTLCGDFRNALNTGNMMLSSGPVTGLVVCLVLMRNYT